MNRKWWKEATVYQIYPRSFKDSNGDGIGDIPGVIEKLDYIKNLNIDVIWLCPVYKSPNDDNGYDVSDYRGILPEFGTMEQFDELLRGAHDRGMRLVMDLVANHTSDEHQWFVESRSSVDDPKRDYYLWRRGDNGTPPNNWQSFFGGDAWEYDTQTGEYYLHLFTRKQPDLNWDNAKVREDIHDLMRFWLDKGIDGFRMDVISLISKGGYADSPFGEFNETIKKVYANGPRIHEFLNEMNRKVISNYDVMTVGEGPGIDLENGLDYVDECREELNMIFHFDHMFIDHGPEGKFDPVPYDLVRFKEIFSRWDERLKDRGWGSIFLGNHDFPRIVSRFGDDAEYWEKSAKALAMMLHTLRGTVYIYQGDEIGMTNVAFDSFEEYDDVEITNIVKEYKRQGKNLDQLLKVVHRQGRDNARTPMQWNKDLNGGFTTGSPWIKLNPSYEKINVADQENEPNSILNFYRQMISFRKDNLTLVYGDYECIDESHAQVFAYWRWDEESVFLVLVNFSERAHSFAANDKFEILDPSREMSNYSEGHSYQGNVFNLRPWESTLYRVK